MGFPLTLTQSRLHYTSNWMFHLLFPLTSTPVPLISKLLPSISAAVWLTSKLFPLISIEVPLLVNYFYLLVQQFNLLIQNKLKKLTDNVVNAFKLILYNKHLYKLKWTGQRSQNIYEGLKKLVKWPQIGPSQLT